MIPINLHHCNIFSGNFLQDTFDMIRLYVQFTSSCIRHGYYERSYLLTAGDLVGEGTKIRILRVKCKHCGRTHAILPEEIAPYLPFSTVFIFPVLRLYYEKKETIESICSRFQIAIPQLYRWKNRFEKQKDQFLGALESAKHEDSGLWGGDCREVSFGDRENADAATCESAKYPPACFRLKPGNSTTHTTCSFTAADKPPRMDSS